MANIRDVAQYIIKHDTSKVASLTHLKLQKLLYYCQAWHLAFYSRPLFPGAFQAWVHGPVSREIYDALNQHVSMYDVVPETIQLGNAEGLNQEEFELVDNVLEQYAKFTGGQLEVIAHRESPWITARGGLPPFARCETIISEAEMTQFYAAQLQ